VVAVTKGFSMGAVQSAVSAGIYDIGENYADELLAKAAAFEEARDTEHPRRSDAVHGAQEVRWHYLGAIHRRRVRDLAPVVGLWETVARKEEGEAIARRAGSPAVMVEVEATGLPGRNGARPHDVPELVWALRDLGLDVVGLMTVGPPGPPEGSRDAFRITARICRELGLPRLSMGMTDDLEVAVGEGATMVRVGRALFGDRPARRRFGPGVVADS
jgi:uncharacterized pyridoxal phosphate-containing UPF0001 family protein